MMSEKRKLRLSIACKIFTAKNAMQKRIPSPERQTGKGMAKESLILADTLINMEVEMFGEEGN